jgi:hypothetical protein
MTDYKIPTVDDVRALNEQNRRYNEAIGRSEKRYYEFWTGPYIKPANNWKEIHRAKRERRGTNLWISGFIYGVVITFAIMSYLTWLAWRAF